MNYRNYYFYLLGILSLFLNNSMSNLFFLLVIVAGFMIKNKWNFEKWLLAHSILISFFIHVCVVMYQTGFIGVFNFGIDLDNNNSKFLFIGLFALTFINVYIFLLSRTMRYQLRNKPGQFGPKGVRGFRGKKGKRSNCTDKCNDGLCYQKLLANITASYNEWRKIKGFSLLAESSQIKNNFLKDKAKKMCNSPQFQKMIKANGAQKTYDYLYKIWRTWIHIILKYDNGMYFLDSESLIGNEFDYLISDIDKEYSSYDNLDEIGTPSRGQESPFDEIKKYDVWYWGELKAAKPRIIEDCESKETGDILSTDPILKVKNTYKYENTWRSATARQSLINKCIKTPTRKCEEKKTYAPFRQKGSSKVSVFRVGDVPKDPKSVKFNNYKPLGDVLLKNDIDKANTRKKTLIVAGEVKAPIGYKKIFSSKRVEGTGKNNYGYSFWRPIPPKGYKCVGDILDKGFSSIPPSNELINCVPEKCVRKGFYTKPEEWGEEVWDSSKDPSDKCVSDCNCENEFGEGSKKDTDINDGEVKLYKNPSNNLFKAVSDTDKTNELYEIIPAGETGDDGQISCLEHQPIDRDQVEDRWIVPEKHGIKYSIFDIYNK